jgi:hypothetical protein
MENRKCIMVDESLHKRLKTYCASQGISISSYVDNSIHQFLVGDELSIDEKWKELQIRFRGLMEKMKDSGNDFVESDEYKQYFIDLDTFWNEKDGQ